MNVRDIVKYARPEPGEEAYRFTLIEMNGDHCLCELICNETIKPVETLSIFDIVVDKPRPLVLTVEWSIIGPLAIKSNLCQLQRIADLCTTLDDAAKHLKISFPNLGFYRGGSHIAVHEEWRGKLHEPRLAIITE